MGSSTRLILAATMAALGTGMLVASPFAAGSGPATRAAGGAQRGGTLRVNYSLSDFEYIDPQLAYDVRSWQALYPTSMLLLGYPEKAGAEGKRLEPQGATGFPTVSKDGKTYTFTIRSGLRFSDGSPVTAAAYKRAFERLLSPKMGSPRGPNILLDRLIVGADAYLSGKETTLTGVSADGQMLTVRLTRADATFLAMLGMPWFTATKPGTPFAPAGLNAFPSAGPYTITSREPGRSLVLERNRYYRGPRPANPDRIAITVNTDLNQSLLQVKSGEADLDMLGLPPSAHEELAAQYGINKGRYFVGKTLGTAYVALNTSRPVFSNVNLRKAVNWAIDRPALVRVSGKYAGARTDQILPPAMAGFRDVKIYAIRGADPAKARQVAQGAGEGKTVTLLHSNSPSNLARAQIIQYNLKQIGMDVRLEPVPARLLLTEAGKRNTDADMILTAWIADYPDPSNFINVLLDGTTIQEENNVNQSYWNNPAYIKRMREAATLTGDARYSAYAKLDLDITKNEAPWASYMSGNNRFFVSARIEHAIYVPALTWFALNAMAIR